MVGILTKNWRDYVWLPSGEVVRGIETTFLAAFLQALLTLNPATLEHSHTWLLAVFIGAALPALGYLKGKVPRAEPDPTAAAPWPPPGTLVTGSMNWPTRPTSAPAGDSPVPPGIAPKDVPPVA